jgi:hypothetical protein
VFFFLPPNPSRRSFTGQQQLLKGLFLPRERPPLRCAPPTLRKQKVADGLLSVQKSPSFLPQFLPRYYMPRATFALSHDSSVTDLNYTQGDLRSALILSVTEQPQPAVSLTRYSKMWHRRARGHTPIVFYSSVADHNLWAHHSGILCSHTVRRITTWQQNLRG